MGDPNEMVIIRRLVEFVLNKKSIIREESVEGFCFTADFVKNMEIILPIRRLVVLKRYGEAFVNQMYKMLSSHENYLTYVLFACLLELENNPSVFDSFTSVIAVVFSIGFEIISIIGLDFKDLNCDIVMVFFQKFLKKPFFRRRGLYRFSAYVRDHRYLAWYRSRNFIDDKFDPYLFKVTDEELKRCGGFVEVPFDAKSSKMEIARSLAKEVLSIPTVELPTLLSESDLIAKLVAYRKSTTQSVKDLLILIQKCLTKPLPENLSLNSDAEINAKQQDEVTLHDGIDECNAKQQDEVTRHESIIRAVVKCNHSKDSDDEEVKDQICKKADGILSNLRNAIESLTKVLDKFNTE